MRNISLFAATLLAGLAAATPRPQENAVSVLCGALSDPPHECQPSSTSTPTTSSTPTEPPPPTSSPADPPTPSQSSPPGCPPVGYVKCETTAGSPLMNDCNALYQNNELKDDANCGASGGEASSGCHSYSSIDHGTCRMSVCQPGLEGDLCIPDDENNDDNSCGVQYLQLLLDQCGWIDEADPEQPEYVGGYVHVPLPARGDDMYLNFALIHS